MTPTPTRDSTGPATAGRYSAVRPRASARGWPSGRGGPDRRVERASGRVSSRGENCGLVHGIAAELVELGREELARIGRFATRRADRVPIERNRAQLVRLVYVECDVAAEPRAKPAGEQQRIRLGACDGDLLHVRDSGPELGERCAPPKRAAERDVRDRSLVERGRKLRVVRRDVGPLAGVDDEP